jgi:hypothetical protein
MEPASPARLFASLAGAMLLVLGIVGFFYDASFTSLDDLQPALGAIDVNAWFNLLYVFTGAVGVLVAGMASRQYAVVVGVLYGLLGLFGPGTEWLHLVIGVLGLAAAAGTRKPGRASVKRRPSKARAKPVRDGA